MRGERERDSKKGRIEGEIEGVGCPALFIATRGSTTRRFY